MSLVFLVKDFEQVVDAHGDSDHLLCVTPKILAEPVEFKLVGNEVVVAACPERVDTMKEVPVINMVAKGHIVCRNGFRDRSGGVSCLEKVASRFLAGSNFGECAILGVI